MVPLTGSDFILSLSLIQYYFFPDESSTTLSKLPRLFKERLCEEEWFHTPSEPHRPKHRWRPWEDWI